MPAVIRLLVAHPRMLVRMGLLSMLAKSGIEIVAEAETAAATLAATRKHKPAAALVDISLSAPGGDGFDLLKRLRKASPDMRLIAMSAIENPTYLARAKAIGAADFVTEAVTRADLVTLIQNAVTGGEASRAFTRASELPHLHGLPLTPREQQVLAQLAHGLSNDEIASAFGISIETVKEHVQNILRKLGVRDRTQAAVLVVRRGQPR
jgi:DNA-binding NarL/FixJ family response regulator